MNKVIIKQVNVCVLDDAIPSSPTQTGRASVHRAGCHEQTRRVAPPSCAVRHRSRDHPGRPTGQAPPGSTSWPTVSCGCRGRNDLFSCRGSMQSTYVSWHRLSSNQFGRWHSAVSLTLLIEGSRLSSPFTGRVEILNLQKRVEV